MYFRSSSDILAGRTKSVQIDIAILDSKKYVKKLKKFRKKLYEKNKIDYKKLGGRYNGPSRRKCCRYCIFE